MNITALVKAAAKKELRKYPNLLHPAANSSTGIYTIITTQNMKSKEE